MTPSLRAAALLTVLLPLAGCAPVDWSEAVAESRSDCDTSVGEFLPAQTCTFSHSRTVSRTTSTTTTTTQAAPEQAPPSITEDDAAL